MKTLGKIIIALSILFLISNKTIDIGLLEWVNKNYLNIIFLIKYLILSTYYFFTILKKIQFLIVKQE